MLKSLREIAEKRTALVQRLQAENIAEEEMKAIESEMEELDKEERRVRSLNKLNTTNMDNTDDKNQDDTEERNAKESGKIRIGARRAVAALSRSTTIATSSLSKPSGAGSEIKDNLEKVSSVVDRVNIQNLEGCGDWTEPYVKTDSEATLRTDGIVGNESDPVFRNAKLMPVIVNVLSYVSKNINKLSPADYVSKIEQLAFKALRQKVSNLIVNGNGNFYGIKTATNTDSEAIYDTLSVDTATIDADTLNKIVFAYGGDESLGGNAVLQLNKSDLKAFGDVRGTNEKKAVYEITPNPGNPNTGTIKQGGIIVPYAINSHLTALSTSTRGASAIKTMIYGDLENYELGLFSDYTVEVSKDYKFGEGLLTINGEVLVGGNVTVHKGFVVVTLSATE